MPFDNLTPGNLAYLTLVLVAFLSFMVLLFGTWAYVNLEKRPREPARNPQGVTSTGQADVRES